MKSQFRTISRSLVLALGLGLYSQLAAAQPDRIVALVIAVGDGLSRADEVQSQLQLIGAETLRADNPNNSEVRSMLRRFADEAENARASLVYLDMPAVRFSEREFVMPDSADLVTYSSGLDRPTDLFTKSIPLLAFARTAALAEDGGAVLITVSAPDNDIPEGLSILADAPSPKPGASPILVVSDENSGPVLTILKAAAGDDTIEISALLRRMSVKEGVSISQIPPRQIFLKAPPPQEPVFTAATPQLDAEDTQDTQNALPKPVTSTGATEPSTDSSDATAAQVNTDALTVASAPEPEETLEELTIMEQSLSRSAKRTLQRKLRSLGHYKGLVDGIFGPQTRDAINAYQTSREEPATGFLTRRQLLDLNASG